MGVGLPKCYNVTMLNRKTLFVVGEYYHLFNRGVDKRDIFSEIHDLNRFFQSLLLFNTKTPIGSIYEKSKELSDDNRFGALISNHVSFYKQNRKNHIINIIAYCLNPNHFHLLIKPQSDQAVSEFMQRMGGYTNYFNEKYSRSGSLFQGKFKSVHIQSNEQLLHVSAYINLNNTFGGRTPKKVFSKSSFGEYISESADEICEKEIILGQFKNKAEYEKFARSSLESILEKKQKDKELEKLLLEDL